MKRPFDHIRSRERRRKRLRRSTPSQEGWLKRMSGFFARPRESKDDQEIQLKAELKRIRKSREAQNKKAYKAEAGVVNSGAFMPMNRASLDTHSRYRRRNYYQICFYTLGVLILLGFIGSIYYRYVL